MCDVAWWLWCCCCAAENDVKPPRTLIVELVSASHVTPSNHDTTVTMREYLQDLTAPPAQTLRTLRPTPTAVSYIVSTRPVPTTIAAQILRYISVLLRVAVLLATLSLLWAKWHIPDERASHIEAWIVHILKDKQLDTFIESCQWSYLVPCTLVVVFLVFKRNYTGPASGNYPPCSS